MRYEWLGSSRHQLHRSVRRATSRRQYDKIRRQVNQVETETSTPGSSEVARTSKKVSLYMKRSNSSFIKTPLFMCGTPVSQFVAEYGPASSMMRTSTGAAMATSAIFSGRVAAFVSSGGLWRHAGIGKATTARCFSMSIDQEKVGFIGLGIMGDGMARNLIKGGREVVVWNRTGSKAADFSKQTGCETAGTPREVVEKCDIVYSMLSTPEAAADVFFDPKDGVLAGLKEGKSLVDCATLQVEDMQDMYGEATGKGAKFLEAPVSGSKGPAANGQLVFLCGGDKDLFDRATKDLDLMGKASHYLGPVGKGTEMKLVVNMVMSTMLASVAEGMCLSDSLGLNNDALIEILGQGAMASPMIALKGPLMNKKDYSSNFPLKHAQKDMRFALGLGDKAAQALPVAAAANAEYIRAKEQHADDDFCAVIEALRSKP